MLTLLRLPSRTGLGLANGRRDGYAKAAAAAHTPFIALRIPSHRMCGDPQLLWITEQVSPRDIIGTFCRSTI